MKWWFTDYDGTVNLNNNHKIEEKDLNFIYEWVASGNKLVFASGRMGHEIKNVLTNHKLEYDFIIANHGSCVYDKNDNLIFEASIEKTIRKKILDSLEKHHDQIAVGYCLKDEKREYFRFKNYNDIDQFLFNFSPKQDNYDEGYKDIINSDDLNIIYVYINIGQEKEIIDSLKDISEVKSLLTGPHLIEIIPNGVSKASGIKVIANIYNIDGKDIYTSGDGDNDIEMLEFTKNSFAMKNGTERAKKAGQFIISNVCEIAKYIKK